MKWLRILAFIAMLIAEGLSEGCAKANAIKEFGISGSELDKKL